MFGRVEVCPPARALDDRGLGTTPAPPPLESGSAVTLADPGDRPTTTQTLPFGTTLRPKVGSEVGLLVCQPEEDQSFELRGKVIRLTESGFSIAYGKAPAELHLLLLDANPDTAPFDGATPTADEPSEESHYSIAQLEALVSRITAEIERKKRD